MYSTHNEGKSVLAKKFIKPLKAKFYLSYLNKLVDEYNNTYHHYIDKKTIDADYYTLSDKNWEKP